MLKVFMGPNNGGRYSNEQADQLLAQASVELNEQKRMDLYKQLQDLALETRPTIPLLHDDYLIVHHRDLEGYDATAYGVTLSTMHWAG